MTQNDQADQTNDKTDAQAPSGSEAKGDQGGRGGGSDDYATDRAEGDKSEVGKLRKEAARYRTERNEARAERDQFAARISEYDRAEVDRQITGAGGLQNASDFWLAGVQLDELRDDEGALDPEKIKAARKRVLSEHPHWREQGPGFDAGAREPAPADKTPRFGEALKKSAG